MESEITKILVVDDERYIGDLLARYLRSEGYVCSAVCDAEKALEKLQQEDFQLVLADIMMPGMSGLDLLNIIRTLYPETAVLMVTAVNDRETGVLAIETGAYGYIIKPFERNEILINVANALERRRLTISSLKKAGHTTVRPKLSVKRPEPIRIRAEEAAEIVRSGMDDAAIMKKFNLSAKALSSLFDQLVEAGYLTRFEVDNRGSLSPGTVTIDAADLQFPAPDRGKPSINAKEAINCIRSGMDDSALMTRYKVSAKGLRSLFRKLVAAGVIEQSELDRRMSETHSWAVLDEDS